MANVFAQFAQPVKSVQQYDDERDAREANRLTLQDKRRTSALADASALEATEDRNALRRIAVDAQGDPLKMVDAARKSGRPNLLMQAATWEKDYLGRRETDSKIAGEDARTAKIGFETREAKRRSAIQQVAALNSPEEAIQLLNQQVTAGAIPMQYATALERMVKTDPKWQVRLVLGINDPKEMLSALQPHMQNAGGSLVNTNPLAGPTGQGAPNAIPITESANEQLQARTSRANNAATVAATIRGQDLTDARQRELNENNRQTKVAPKPMPGTAVKLQNEDLEAIGTFRGLDSDLAALESQLTGGKLKLGLVTNAAGTARNAVGLSSENSRNLASFKAKLENMRNAVLLLNKGVQTEGDANRAMAEIMANINDGDLVKQRLAEIRALNRRAADLRRNNVDLLRSNYGAEPLDYSKYDQQPSALDLAKPNAAPAKTNGGATTSNW